MRVIFERSSFHGGRFRTMVDSTLRNLVKSGQLKVFLTGVFLDPIRPPNGVTTYVEFDWRAKGADLLHTVVTGPAQEERMAREFVEKCLEVSGILAAGINIRHPAIPYRG
jgi:hypothetical protein